MVQLGEPDEQIEIIPDEEPVPSALPIPEPVEEPVPA